MPRNGSGTYVPPTNSWNPAVAATTITADDWNELRADLTQALTTSIATDGQSPTTARIPFSAGVSSSSGSVSSPAYTAISDTASGLYFPASNQVALAAAGVAGLTLTSTTCTVPIALTVTGALSANGGVTTTTLTASGAGSIAGAFTASDNAKVAGSGKTLGFYGANGTTKPTISGSRGGNAALASLITALANLGICTDGTSA